jgi:hypothetical protein
LIDCHHLLLTVCHNFKDGNLVSISNGSGNEFVIEIPHQFQCIRGVPRYEIWASMDIQPSTRDIDIPGHLVEHLGSSINLAEARVKDLGALRMPPGIPIQCVLGVVDFSVITDLVDVDLFDPFDDQELNKLSPLSLPVHVLRALISNQRLTVYKKGAKTGTTSGKLVEIGPEIMEDDDGETMPVEGSVVGHVKWNAPDEPFAEPGDSGALVWAVIRARIVPIGIHKGSLGDVSHCLLLEPCFDVLAEVYKHDYVFCSSEKCDYIHT